MDKVIVKNTLNHAVSIIVPSLNLKRDWPGKGASHKFDMEVVEEMMYDPGVKYMFDNGILYIEDMEVKKELGLEPEEAAEPVNIIVLSDEEKRKCLISYSMDKFKETVDKLSVDQLRELSDYAIEHRMVDFDRDEYIKEKGGRDIISAIRLNNSNKEE